MRNLLYVSIILLLSCESSKKRPDDFQFQLIYLTDSYNSETGRFLREHISLEPRKDTVVTETLTSSELDSAYRVVFENHFFSLPETFECDESKEYTVTVPFFDRTIIVNSGGRTQKVTHNSLCSPKMDIEAEKRFEIINKKLKEIIYKRNSIKNLPKTKMVFL